MLRLVRTNASERFDEAKAALLAAAPALIDMSFEIYNAHAMTADGKIYGFSYYENSPMNTSQGAPVAHSAYREADINSTMLATSSFLGVLFGTLNAAADTDLTDGKNVVKTIPLWNCYRDLDIFVDAWQNAKKASNEIQDPSTITFDSYIEDEEHEGNEKYPDSLIYVNVGGANTSSVEQAPGKNNGDLALKVNHVKDASNVEAFVSMIDEKRESTKLYYEMDVYVEDFKKNDGLFMQVNFVDGVYASKMLTGFNLYREDEDTIRIQSSYNHLGNNKKHEEETVDVNYIDNWVNLKFETEKTYTDGVLTGLTTVIYVNGTAYTFSDTFALDKTTDAEGDIVDVNVGRVQLVYYKQGTDDVDSTIWIDNVYCGKYKEQTTAN
jgi:hypothetical protein